MNSLTPEEQKEVDEDLANEHAYLRANGMAYDPEAGGFVCRRHKLETVTRRDGTVVTFCLNGCKDADVSRQERREADRVDGYDRDDLGESPDY